MMNHATPTSPARKRPRIITLAALVYLLFSILGWLRFQQTISASEWLNGLDIFPPPIYIALTGTSWGLIGLWAAVALFMGRRSAPLLAQIAAAFIVTSYWLDYFLFSQPPFHLKNNVFEIIISLFGLLAAACLPRLPASQRFFNETSGS